MEDNSPDSSSKLYPDLPVVNSLVGFKRKAGSGVALTDVEKRQEEDEERVIVANKENILSIKKKQKRSSETEILKLQDAIDKETKIRDGASKLLPLSKNSKQSMEASKSLFVSNMKILGLMKQLQKVKREQKEGIPVNYDSEQTLEPCQAKLGISDIRLPLEWKEFENAKGKFDSNYKVGVFCLFRLGDQVVDTPSLIEVDRSMVDISFPDIIIFPNKVDHDFTLIAEVYCSVPFSETTNSSSSGGLGGCSSSTPSASGGGKESTPLKVLKKFKKEFSHELLSSPSLSTSTLSLSSPSTYTPQLPNVNPTHSFTIAGHTKFTLKDVMGTCRTYTISLGAVGSSGTSSSVGKGNLSPLPLWGQICCSLMAEPTCATQPRCTGFINIQQMVSGYPAWLRQWCVLRQHNLRCWTYPEDVGRKMPANTVTLTKEMTVENAPRLTMRRPNTLLIKDHETDEEYFMSFECKEERDHWSTVLRQAILDLKIWKDATNYIIPKQSSKFYNNREGDNFDVYKRGNAFSQYTPPTETVL